MLLERVIVRREVIEVAHPLKDGRLLLLGQGSDAGREEDLPVGEVLTSLVVELTDTRESERVVELCVGRHKVREVRADKFDLPASVSASDSPQGAGVTARSQGRKPGDDHSEQEKSRGP